MKWSPYHIWSISGNYHKLWFLNHLNDDRVLERRDANINVLCTKTPSVFNGSLTLLKQIWKTWADKSNLSPWSIYPYRTRYKVRRSYHFNVDLPRHAIDTGIRLLTGSAELETMRYNIPSRRLGMRSHPSLASTRFGEISCQVVYLQIVVL